MIASVFYMILNMSILGSGLMLLIWLIRLGVQKGLKQTFYYGVWGIVLIRLLVPVGVSSPLSIMGVFDESMIKSVEVMSKSGTEIQLSMMNSLQAVQDYEAMTYKSEVVKKWLNIGGIVWLSGVVVLSAFWSVAYVRMHAQVNRYVKIKVSGRLVESPQVVSPFVWGIVKPRILIPMGTSENNQSFLVAHEQVHIHRQDNLLKLIALLAVIIHWMNPLIWWFYGWFIRDMEKSCDQKVLKSLNLEQRKSYATLLVFYAQKHQSLYASFGQSATSERIIKVLTYKKTPFVLSILLGIMYGVMFIGLLTNR